MEIGGTDVTTRIYSAEFNRPVTTGIGDFKIRLINVKGVYSNTWFGSEIVNFYADLIGATNLQFKGRVDFVKEVLTEGGQFLDIEGRHTSYDLTEVSVSKSYTADDDIDGSDVLKDLIDTYLTGYTYTNVASSIGTDVVVNWSNKPFWECVIDLCVLCNADCYVDDAKDFHFFAENSIVQTQDAIVEGHNLKQLRNWGKDTFFEKTRIRVIGEDDRGVPILYTKNPGGTREKTIVDSSIKTMDEAEDRADAEYTDLTLANIPPQGTTVSKGLRFAQPGDNIWISTPRQKVHGLYKVIELKHKIGTNVGTWITECIVEKEEKGTSQVLKERTKKELQLTKVQNPNDLEYSYNFTFEDTTNILSLTDTQVSEGFLKLVEGKTTGTMITDNHEADTNISQIELRWEGENLAVSTFEVSVDAGTNYEELERDEMIDMGFVGKNLKIRVTLLSDANNKAPRVDSLAVLYK